MKTRKYLKNVLLSSLMVGSKNEKTKQDYVIKQNFFYSFRWQKITLNYSKKKLSALFRKITSEK